MPSSLSETMITTVENKNGTTPTLDESFCECTSDEGPMGQYKIIISVMANGKTLNLSTIVPDLSQESYDQAYSNVMGSFVSLVENRNFFGT